MSKRLENEIKRLNKIIDAYRAFESDVDSAAHKVNNSRLDDALKELGTNLKPYEGEQLSAETEMTVMQFLNQDRDEDPGMVIPTSELDDVLNAFARYAVGEQSLNVNTSQDYEILIRWGKR